MHIGKKAARVTEISIVFMIIKSNEKGTITQQIMKNSGFSLNKTRGIIAQLKKQGKIKSVSRGVYILNRSQWLPPALLVPGAIE
jgi:predicted transcriptional regulator